MPVARPTYVRQDTDTAISLRNFDDKGESSKSKLGESEQVDTEFGGGKTDAHVDNQEVLPQYDEEGQTLPQANNVNGAEDLVTQVLHVEDDPTLNPWTFRMFFLGKEIQSICELRAN